jgi:tetratricopeptide (TPR) repeat protein
MRYEAKRARAELERSLTLAAKPTLSYEYLIEIAMLTTQREDERSLIEQANALDPLNYYPRSAYVFALQPWWGGSIREMRQFLDAYRKLGPPQWKGDCLEAIIVEREPPPRRSASGALSALIARIAEWFYRVPERGAANDPANAAPEPLNRAIELCPTAERLATRGRYWEKHERPDLAEQEYRRALEIDRGYVWAQAALGARLVTERKAEEGVELCRAAAERGDAQAQYCLGYAYSSGSGIDRNAAEALRWISSAADNGAPTAIGAMGSRYWSGNGVAQDKDKAIELWRKAARLGDANAKKRLAEVGAGQ